MISCESKTSDNDEEIVQVSEISNDVAEELDDNLDAVEGEILHQQLLA